LKFSGANLVDLADSTGAWVRMDLDILKSQCTGVEMTPVTHLYRPHETDLIEIGFMILI
jgi:hypothetical protein